MKLEDALQSGNVPASWTPTMNLRWIKKTVKVDEMHLEVVSVLQQMWQDYKGNQEWRDIEWAI